VDAPGALFKAVMVTASHRATTYGPLRHHRNPGGAVAHLHRLIFAVLVTVFSLAVQASIPTVPQVSGTWGWGGPGASAVGASAAEVCAALTPAFITQYTAPGVTGFNVVVGQEPTVTVSGYCQGSYVHPDGDVRYPARATLYLSGGVTCPPNSTLSGGACVCTPSMVEDSTHTSCVPPPDPCGALKGQSAGNWWRDTGDDNGLPAKIGFSVCDKYQSVGSGLCVASVPATGGLCVQTEGGWWRCTGQAFYTGSKAADPSKCSLAGPGGSGNSPADPMPATPPSGNPPQAPSQPDPNTAAPAPCPAGQAPGTINGTSVCRPTGGDRPATGSAPGTGSTTRNNSDGSSTTSTTSGTTRCAEGQCTTTTNNVNTTINAPGNTTCPTGQTAGTTMVNGQSRTTCTGTSSATTSQAQSEFCTANPKDKQCGGDGADTSFGGSCASGFKAVSDDAVLNAMAEEQYRRNCEVLRTDTEPSAWAAAEGAKTGNAMDGNPNNDSVSVGPGNFDQSDALGGGGCNLNKTFTVRGLTVNMPWNVLCDPLAMLGQILVAVSLLLAARIVTRG